MSDTAIRPFRVEIPQADLDDLPTGWTAPAGPTSCPAPADYGVTATGSRRWPSTGATASTGAPSRPGSTRYPQFTTEIDGQNIHFLHVRSPEPDALPLILTHGWPGSVVEFLDVIDPLTEPPTRRAGLPPGRSRRCPGFGFSGPTRSAAGTGTASPRPGPS